MAGSIKLLNYRAWFQLSLKVIACTLSAHLRSMLWEAWCTHRNIWTVDVSYSYCTLGPLAKLFFGGTWVSPIQYFAPLFKIQYLLQVWQTESCSFVGHYIWCTHSWGERERRRGRERERRKEHWNCCSQQDTNGLHLYYTILYYTMLCYAMLCHAMSCHAILYYNYNYSIV